MIAAVSSPLDSAATALAGAATKHRPPSFREGFVDRPRLVRRLLDGAAAPVAVLAAPAGYGKTTLLSEWDRHDPRPFAWVTLTDADNEPELLPAELTRALAESEPLETGLQQLVAPPRSPGTRLARLVRALELHPPFVLVLDDVHVLQEPEALELVRTLADHMPTGSQLALASRGHPELPVGRLRGHRALIEIGPADLGMRGPEAASLLRLAGLELAPRDVEALVELTEGWPVALYLAAVSLRDETDVAEALAGFGGDDPYVAEYIRDELLAPLTRGERAFLTRTSVLDRLSGPLCDAVVERRGSARMLSGLARGNVLITPLDRHGTEYRRHGLLTDALRMELRRVEPYAEPDLHGRASYWHAGHGDAERAIEHAIAAGDVARAGNLLWASGREYVSQGRNDVVRGWLERFTADEVSAHPTLALTAAYSELADGELDAALRWESAARRALHETPPRKRSEPLSANLVVLHAAVARNGVVNMGKDAARARERTAEDSSSHAVCHLLEGVAQHLTGDRTRAQKSLEDGVRRAAIKAPNVQTLCLAQLALLAAERENWEAGAAYAARATAQMQAYSLTEYPMSALVFAASAVVRAPRGRVDEAQRDVRHATRLLDRITDFIPWFEAETRIALARVTLRLGDVVKARELLAQAAEHEQRAPDAILLRQWIDEIHTQIETVSASTAGRPRPLTAAELRVLVQLPTHLSFREIADRLCVSANTIKTQAHAVYRKLDASSRSEAVARATELGLLDSTPNG